MNHKMPRLAQYGSHNRIVFLFNFIPLKMRVQKYKKNQYEDIYFFEIPRLRLGMTSI